MWVSCSSSSGRQTACPATTAAQVLARHHGDRINKNRNSNHLQTATISHSDHTFTVAHLDHACTLGYWIIAPPPPAGNCWRRPSARIIKPRSGGMQYGLTLQQPLMSNGAAGQNIKFIKHSELEKRGFLLQDNNESIQELRINSSSPVKRAIIMILSIVRRINAKYFLSAAKYL